MDGFTDRRTDRKIERKGTGSPKRRQSNKFRHSSPKANETSIQEQIKPTLVP